MSNKKKYEIGGSLAASLGGAGLNALAPGLGTALSPLLAMAGDEIQNQLFANGGQLPVSTFNGNTHEQGGIPINKKVEVEDGEVKFDDYIFSNRLQANDKQTFAEAAKKILKKYGTRSNDQISERAIKSEMASLRSQQEEIRQNIATDTIQKAFGGPLKKNKGLVDDPDIFNLNGNSIEAKKTGFRGMSIPDSDNKAAPLNNIQPNSNTQNDLTTSATPFDKGLLFSLGNYAGPLYDIYRGIKGADPVSFQRVKPNLVDTIAQQQVLGSRIADSSSRLSASIRSSGLNPGQILAAETANAVNAQSNLGRQEALIAESANNQNAQILNQVGAQNAQIQQAESIARQQEKDVASNILGSGISGVGQATSLLGRDIRQTNTQNNMLNLLETSNFAIDKDQNGKLTIRYRNSG